MRRARSFAWLVPLVLSPLAPSCKSASSAPPPYVDPFADVPVSTRLQLEHLSGPVSVARDAHGMVHIEATSITDALRVEGYQVARDRTAQLELNRREATGRLAEVLGDVSPELIDSDIAMRTIGLNREGQAMYDALDPSNEGRQWLDAYADGVSQFNARVQSGEESIPDSMLGFPHSAFAPWTGADVLAIARLQAWNLAYEGPSDIANTDFVTTARATFSATATDPLVQKRAGFLGDVVRFAPLDSTTVLPGFPGATTAAARAAAPRVAPFSDASRDLLRDARAWSAATERVHRVFARDHFGSNDWIVAPSLSANGHALLANDPHLSLSAPSTFWAVHVKVDSSDPAQKIEFAGMAFPGLIGIILGFNPHVAWGATDAYFDVSDVYQEKLTPDGAAVVFNGQNVPLQKVHEEIKVANGAPVEYDVLVVPHHGPIVPNIVNHAVVAPDPSKGALSTKWTGDQVTHDVDAIKALVRAGSVDEGLAAMGAFAIGAENWVLADTAGNIGYTTSAIVPQRDPRAFAWDGKAFRGTLPCFVEPGDGTAEWTGAIDPKFLPQAKNPAAGFLVTANNDQVGTTTDDDPSNDELPDGTPTYLQCFYDPGLRAGRITRDIQTAGKKLTVDDLAAIQADGRSNLGPLVMPSILAALDRAQKEKQTPGSQADLTAIVADPRYAAANVGTIAALFTEWQADGFDTPAGVSLDDGSLSTDAKESAQSEATLLFNAWITTMEHDTFGDELAKMGIGAPPGRIDLRQALTFLLASPDKTKLATYDAATGDSALYDDMTTAAVETRDERIVRALLDAVDGVKTALGADDAKWRWGKLHTLTFDSLVPFWGWMSIPPTTDPTFAGGFPRHGEAWTVDVGDPGDWLDPKALAFPYTNGPVQRLVVDLDPQAGALAKNALPGGEVWDDKSPHFRDEAELWRRNQNHPVATAHADVVSGADEHLVYSP